MSWLWALGALTVWSLSAACIIGTMVQLAGGKTNLRKGDFWGGVAFHGVTAILALFLLLRAL